MMWDDTGLQRPRWTFAMANGEMVGLTRVPLAFWMLRDALIDLPISNLNFVLPHEQEDSREETGHP